MKQSKLIRISQTEALVMQSLCAGKTRTEIMEERGICSSTLSCHCASISGKLAGGWRDDASDEFKTPTMIQNIVREIESLVKDGKNPLIQSDVISSRALLREILIRKNCYPCDAQIAQALKLYGMEAVGRALIVGERHYIWAIPTIDRNHAVNRIHARMLGK